MKSLHSLCPGFLISMLKALLPFQGWKNHPKQTPALPAALPEHLRIPSQPNFNAAPLKASHQVCKPHPQSLLFCRSCTSIHFLNFFFPPPCFVINNCQALKEEEKWKRVIWGLHPNQVLSSFFSLSCWEVPPAPDQYLGAEGWEHQTWFGWGRKERIPDWNTHGENSAKQQLHLTPEREEFQQSSSQAGQTRVESIPMEIQGDKSWSWPAWLDFQEGFWLWTPHLP